MDEIIIGFSRPKGWFEPFSWLIRMSEGTPFKWAPYSHAYIRFYSQEYDRWIIAQASGLKVNFIGQTLFDSLEMIGEEYKVPVTTAVKTALVQNAVDLCGLPYGMGQVIGIPWVDFVGLFGKQIKNPFASNKSFYCSEFVEYLAENDLTDGSSLDPATCTPMKLLAFLIAQNYAKIG